MKPIQIKARGFIFDALTDGPEDGPLLILLHGLPRTSWEWHHQLPKLAEAGFRTVAPDMRGYSPGARPEGKNAYKVREFVKDTLAIADELGCKERPFHLMGISIGAMIAWVITAKYPKRVASLVCINQPHPGAFIEVMATAAADKQRKGYRYFSEFRKEGKELENFKIVIKYMGLPEEETDPYREALSSEEALCAVFHWYRVLSIPPLKPIVVPTLYIWPKNLENVSRETAEAVGKYVKAPYRFEILDEALNFALQMEPEKITRLLLEHLAEHAK
jgi:pimeloyl-ACP methyl ester carboxylesterase